MPLARRAAIANSAFLMPFLEHYLSLLFDTASNYFWFISDNTTAFPGRSTRQIKA
jgi:hypothetical protein